MRVECSTISEVLQQPTEAVLTSFWWLVLWHNFNETGISKRCQKAYLSSKLHIKNQKYNKKRC